MLGSQLAGDGEAILADVRRADFETFETRYLDKPAADGADAKEQRGRSRRQVGLLEHVEVEGEAADRRADRTTTLDAWRPPPDPAVRSKTRCPVTPAASTAGP